jgi:hypothetical protein
MLKAVLASATMTGEMACVLLEKHAWDAYTIYVVKYDSRNQLDHLGGVRLEPYLELENE